MKSTHLCLFLRKRSPLSCPYLSSVVLTRLSDKFLFLWKTEASGNGEGGRDTVGSSVYRESGRKTVGSSVCKINRQTPKHIHPGETTPYRGSEWPDNEVLHPGGGEESIKKDEPPQNKDCSWPFLNEPRW